MERLEQLGATRLRSATKSRSVFFVAHRDGCGLHVTTGGAPASQLRGRAVAKGDRVPQAAGRSFLGDPIVKCQELADFILDYLEGGLETDVRERFERHLSRCANCRRYIAAYKTTVNLSRRAFDDEEATAAGFDHHFTKPLDPAELRRLVSGTPPH
jgi:hypothetical protein